MENILLIGMPGCGKSTVGRLLAEETGRDFFDADAFLAEKAGVTIPEIFAKDGEVVFRKLETETLAELCKRSGCVIATGGGCVTRPENEDILRQNGIVIWLSRNIDRLATSGRPLSAGKDLHAMYKARRPLYEKFSDVRISLTEDPRDSVKKILELNYEDSCH